MAKKKLSKKSEPPRITFEIEQEKRNAFKVFLAKRNITTKDYLTNYIDKVIKNE